ncbi:hypothetical protein F2Q65_01720 [Thiohalocapsa marina]|uniref:Uncharacterized protein n=1 Tax=Thiohalocapsa marina TaxID=424902 RepID=A0A5M8FU16_9GAMM|nr:hypothetical protein [Thiohalocapsa marina]KAA6187273.1 hypothetical protein F2Q65_01720 [Thiohalocapsa marina]
MDSSSIQLPGSEIAGASLQDGTLRVEFARAYIVKTMTGSAERTLWWQAGTLIIDDAEAEQPVPEGPGICDGGDVDENVYTYRNMIPVPLESRGHVRCDLRLRDSDQRIVASGRAVRLQMRDVAKYIRHIRD